MDIDRVETTQTLCQGFNFECIEVDYLGHLIFGAGVSVDPAKIKSMVEWPIPHSIKSLRGFLGLTGYYRKFIRGYGSIAAPLTALLSKNSFKWDSVATKDFMILKEAVTSPPVFALPSFN